VRLTSPPPDGLLAPVAERVEPDLTALLRLDDAGFRAAFRKSAITRTKRRGLARNVAVALGNRGARGTARERAALIAAAASDSDPLVREHAAWALRRLDGDASAPDTPHE
jgi:epoxyqueuosine reductase